MKLNRLSVLALVGACALSLCTTQTTNYSQVIAGRPTGTVSQVPPRTQAQTGEIVITVKDSKKPELPTQLTREELDGRRQEREAEEPFAY